MTRKEASYNPGLSPIKGKKFWPGTQTGSRDEFSSLSLGITNTTPMSPCWLTNQRPSLLYIYIYICVKLTVDNKATADNNYKELYGCKWDPMTMTKNTLYIAAYKILQIFWPDDGLHRPKLFAIIEINKA